MEFACTQCGACCRSRSDYSIVHVLPSHLDELRVLIAGQDVGKRKKYSIHEGDGLIQLGLHGLGTACPFLDLNNRCRIYSERHETCRVLPERYAGDPSAVVRKIYAHCPAMRKADLDGQHEHDHDQKNPVQGLAEKPARRLEIRADGNNDTAAPELRASRDAAPGPRPVADGRNDEHLEGRSPDDGAARARRKRVSTSS